MIALFGRRVQVVDRADIGHSVRDSELGCSMCGVRHNSLFHRLLSEAVALLPLSDCEYPIVSFERKLGRMCQVLRIGMSVD
jgi:hypothetical protein